jgi:predicted Zn finger-like uncharacterized protein
LKPFASSGSTTGSNLPGAVPALCPACRSSSIVTTEKIPSADSYWRCMTCGEVWNDGRRKTNRQGSPIWR